MDFLHTSFLSPRAVYVLAPVAQQLGLEERQGSKRGVEASSLAERRKETGCQNADNRKKKRIQSRTLALLLFSPNPSDTTVCVLPVSVISWKVRLCGRSGLRR